MRCGFIAIAGAPNAGKSTLLNKILGMKLAITSDKPQTTRQRLLGVYSAEETQIVFLDTPGLHKARNHLNKRMMEAAGEALRQADGILFLADVSKRGMLDAGRVAGLVKEAGKPVILGLNKIDALADKKELLPLLRTADSWGEWLALLPLSARSGLGVRELLDELRRLLPAGPALFPEETVTDLSLRFLAGELVREKIFRLTRQDIPYAAAVTVDEFLEARGKGAATRISATVHVERNSQKAIIIGKRGAMLKQIGTEARMDMERLLGGPVFLSLLVRVEENWAQSNKGLNKLGY
ncbi:MAG: GTPase Era [Desulfarculales bacterium]|jgi:GTP-binding protein Era|nr:GTPase Era [Desulfarculales bacterium]